jgi:hypothetical protein
MKIRLYIGDRRFRVRWIKIDDIFTFDENNNEMIIACRGARSLLESTRQRIKWRLRQENKIFVGNIWETAENVIFENGKIDYV